MQETLKKFSPALFVLILICFLLPWVNFSCQGQPLLTLSGFQLVTGTTFKQEDILGETREEKIEPEPLAIVVLIFTILGFGAGFIKHRKASLISSIIGVIGLTLLLFLKSKIENEVATKGEGSIQTEFTVGYWVTFFLFIGAVALNGYFYFGIQKQVKSLPPQT